MDKNEILARSRVENANGDEREQSLVRKSNAFGFCFLDFIYGIIIISSAFGLKDYTKELLIAIASCWLLARTTIFFTQGYYLKKKFYLIFGIIGYLIMILILAIRPLSVFVAPERYHSWTKRNPRSQSKREYFTG